MENCFKTNVKIKKVASQKYKNRLTKKKEKIEKKNSKKAKMTVKKRGKNKILTKISRKNDKNLLIN